jgi:hypothetical protein
MPTDEGPATARPLCRCHGLVMDKAGAGWSCSEARRARQLAAYHADPARANYARSRRALRSRVARKRQEVKRLEATCPAD